MTANTRVHTTPLKTIREVKANTFIFEKPNALPLDICNEIVRRFEASPDEQYAGRVGQTIQQETSIKRSTDLVVSGKEHWKDIDRELFRSLGQAIVEGEFYHWHIDGGSHEFSQRQLVALWYLNDVPGPGGRTEFSYQDVQVTPKAGTLLLFPPFWTHEHRNSTLQQGVKYIATTWVIFA